jgi:3-keto-5-aminohexanoate cleavage enzyme
MPDPLAATRYNFSNSSQINRYKNSTSGANSADIGLAVIYMYFPSGLEGTMDKVILTAALTGGVHGKDANPNLPEQPDEIVAQGLDAWRAGAAVIHVHVRDQAGIPTGDLDIFREVHDRLRSSCDAIIQLTTGGGLGVPIERRLEITSLQPESCSLNLTTCCFTFGGRESFYQNFPSDILAFARQILQLGIKPELECYSIESLDDAQWLIDQGMLAKPYYINIVLGIPAQGALKATPENLMEMIKRLPKESIFNVCATGRMQLPLTTLGMILGGNARVGMEDNVYYSKGRLARDNAELVERTVRIAGELGLEVASPDEARQILKILYPV